MDLKARIKNPTFWAGIISALFLFLRSVADLMQINMPLNDMENVATNLLNFVFGALAIMGVVHDPSTPGIKDNK